jgi:hypothetical protein
LSRAIAMAGSGAHEAIPVEVGHSRDPERHEAQEAKDGRGREPDHDDQHEEVAHAEADAE